MQRSSRKYSIKRKDSDLNKSRNFRGVERICVRWFLSWSKLIALKKKCDKSKSPSLFNRLVGE
jgi:hypothetical protein